MADPLRATISNAPPRRGSEAVLNGVKEPDLDEPHERGYRNAPVRTARLSEPLIEDAGGPLTRKGTPRLALLCAARGAYVQRRSDEAENPIQFDSGEWTPRRKGEHIKSIQGHAEDVWRRIYKRPIPEGDPLDNSDFRALYDRTRRALKRSDLLDELGPAVRCPDKRRQDSHGKRWALSGRLTEAQSGRRSAEPRPFIRCSTDALDGESADLWTRVERSVAREESLHEQFSHAVTACQLDGPRWESEARRWERRYIRDGSESPRYRTIGQWRPETVGRSDRHAQAVRVPWIVAEIDGRGDRGEKDRGVSDRLARRLLRRLKSFGVDLSEVVVSYSGNASIHVRIPDGAVGCPIYRNEQAATEALARFFDRLCGQDEALRQAIDNACFRPSQLIRAIGSTHEATGRQTVGTTADRFLNKPASFLWSLSEPQFQYSPPQSFPVPRRASFCAPVSSLLKPTSQPCSDGDVEKQCSTVCVPPGGGGDRGRVVDRVQSGVREGEPWGPDVGRPEAVGRNWAALFVAHDILRRGHEKKQSWRALRQWNRRNRPKLPEDELRTVFEKACRYQRGTVH